MNRRLLVIALAIFAAGCDDDASTPTSPSAPTPTTTTFTGSLPVGGSRFYSFTVSQSGSVSATLASVTLAQTGAALGTILELGVGFPSGTGCAVTATKNVSPALTAQIVEAIEPGVHCLRVTDIGDMTAPIRFAVRFAYP